MRISDWSSDVCSSDLIDDGGHPRLSLPAWRPRRVRRLIRRSWARRLRKGGIAVKRRAGLSFSLISRYFCKLRESRCRILCDFPHSYAEICAIFHTAWHSMIRRPRRVPGSTGGGRSEEHTSELQSLMRNSYAVFCFKNKKKRIHRTTDPDSYHKNYH